MTLNGVMTELVVMIQLNVTAIDFSSYFDVVVVWRGTLVTSC